MCLQQCFCGDARADSKQPLMAYSCSSEIDMLDDMVQGDMREEARCSCQRRRKEPCKSGHWILRSCKTGEHKVVPNDVRIQPPDRLKQARRSGEAAELPATDHVEP